jgi:hypothetical protein
MPVILPDAGLAAASKCGTWKMVEFGLGWQIITPTVAGAGQSAAAKRDSRQKTNNMTKKAERRSDFMRNNLIQMDFAVVRALLDRVEQFKYQLFVLCRGDRKR